MEQDRTPAASPAGFTSGGSVTENSFIDGLMALPHAAGPRRATVRDRTEASRMEALLARRMRLAIGERLRDHL